MSKGYPSMTALLGLVAVAGYQNRDKLAELFKGHGTDTPRDPDPAHATATSATGTGGLGNLLGGLGTAGVGGMIANGLSELADHFTKGGHGDTARSWIEQGANRDIRDADLEKAIGHDTLTHLSEQTGLDRGTLLSRLSRDLPPAIERFAMDGRRPA